MPRRVPPTIGSPTPLQKAIKSIKTNVPKTEVQKKIRDLKISTQKLKGSKAKLDQSIFEMKTGQPITFKSNKGKSESNKEAYKRIQKDNTKVIKSMIDKATEKKADGGRIGRKMGGGSDMQNTNVKKKYKGFSKLPETVQIKINKKLAKKV